MRSRILPVLIGILLLPGISHAGMPRLVEQESVHVGEGPTSIALDEAGDRVFVADVYGNNVAVIGKVVENNKERHKVLRKIPTNSRGIDINMGANALAYDPGSERLFLPDLDRNFVILDAKGYKPIKVVPNTKGEHGWMSAVHFDRGTGEVITLDWYGFLQTYDIDGKKKKEQNTELGGIKYFTVSADGRTLYVSKGQALYELNAGSGAVIRKFDITTHSVPVIDEASGHVYVGLLKDGKLNKIMDRRVIDYDAVDFPAWSGMGMALNPNTGHLFVPSGNRGIIVFDINDMKEVTRFSIGNHPRSIAVNKKTNMVYISCARGGQVFIIQDQ